MLKKLLPLLLAVLLVLAVGCDQKVVYDDLSNYESGETDVDPSTTVVNKLTGEKNITADKANQRPVAIMINNISIAQKVQTGVNKADIVYETEVEGGLTRMLGVFSDITVAEKIGTVRSARYQFIDLAMGHNAVYIHCGFNVYAKPHLADTDSIDLNTILNKKPVVAKRISNGLSSEHTVYALTDELEKKIEDDFKMSNSDASTWVKFAEDGTPVTLTGGAATNVTVPFAAIKSKFKYDDQSGLYTRILGNDAQKDYFTEETTQVKNIFILLTSMSHFDDKYTRKVSLDGGDGYYVTGGTLRPIKWTKGKASNGFKFTDTDGNELVVNTGKSWVCIANEATCTPTFE